MEVKVSKIVEPEDFPDAPILVKDLVMSVISEWIKGRKALVDKEFANVHPGAAAYWLGQRDCLLEISDFLKGLQ